MQITLEQLTKFVDSQDKDTFIYKDVEHVSGDTYRIFNYRLASFYDFMQDPLSIWCRGTMFNVDTGELISRTPEKFFNHHEWINNNTKLPSYETWLALPKHDGSLISTYVDSKGKAWVKSKYSIESEQAVAAQKVFDNIDTFHNLRHFTYNYEYVAPDNIVILPYARKELKLLSIINNLTGEYISVNDGEAKIVSIHSLSKFIDSTYAYSDELIEGYVMTSPDFKTRFKLKTDRYSSAHKLKDDIHSTKKLVALVLSGEIDDVMNIRDLDFDVEFTRLLVERTEIIKDVINHQRAAMEDFYSKNKNESRKDYANLLKLDPAPFAPTMNLYIGREDKLDEYIMKNMDLFAEIE